ncbi:MAG: hypothetical protein M3Z30_01290, partial [Gemmatimonadota bacterium]|nr:hypothetical protein [Gemmatimonadota bacterium]
MSAQTSALADSGHKADRAAWVAGSAAGGTLFLLFTRSGHTATASATGTGPTGLNGFTSQPGSPNGPGNTPVPSPAGGSTSGTSQGTTSTGSVGDGTSHPDAGPPPSNPPTTSPPNEHGSSGPDFVSAPGNTGTQDSAVPTGHDGSDQSPPPAPKEPPPAANGPPSSTGPAFQGAPPQAPDQPSDQPSEQHDDSPPNAGDSIFTPQSDAGTQDKFIGSLDGT